MSTHIELLWDSPHRGWLVVIVNPRERDPLKRILWARGCRWRSWIPRTMNKAARVLAAIRAGRHPAAPESGRRGRGAGKVRTKPQRRATGRPEASQRKPRGRP